MKLMRKVRIIFLHAKKATCRAREPGIYLRTLIDIITMAAIFVTSEKNRTSEKLFSLYIYVRYSRYVILLVEGMRDHPYNLYEST